MPFTIVRNDITKLRVDAIVNAANTDLAMGDGNNPRELERNRVSASGGRLFFVGRKTAEALLKMGRHSGELARHTRRAVRHSDFGTFFFLGVLTVLSGTLFINTD